MKKQIIFSAVILFTAVVMASCGNKHASRAVSLNNMNDSINYALGHAQGDMFANQFMQGVTDTDAAISAFIDALERAFNSDADPDEMYQLGIQVGNWFQQMERDGLMGEADLQSNTALIRQGLEAGMKGTYESWTPADAQDFIENVLLQIQEERMRAMFDFDLSELFIDEEIIE